MANNKTFSIDLICGVISMLRIKNCSFPHISDRSIFVTKTRSLLVEIMTEC
jgi:hypothetical protein